MKIRLLAIVVSALLCHSLNLMAGTPSRIVSLKPNITEILFALGAGGRVVGVTTWCDRPESAKAVPKVADYININTEKIIALKPDLVIGSRENSIKEQFGVLENAGIKTMTLPFGTMADLYGSIEKIAEAVGNKDAGERLIENIKHVIARSLERQSRDDEAIQIDQLDCFGLRPRNDIKIECPARNDNISARVLILVGRRPLVAAGPKTFYGEIMGLLGAENIVESEKTPYPAINTEFILAKNPDVIIDMTMGSEEGGYLPPALKNKIISFNISEFRAGPGIGEAVKKLSVSLRGSE